MSDIIQLLRESNSALLKAQAKDLAKWSKLKHTQYDLETFLSFNIAEIQYAFNGKNEKVICTNNVPLIEILQTVEPEKKKKLIKADNKTVHNLFKNKRFVGAWDLEGNHYINLVLDSWQINNFISITPDNILILDELINKILKS